MLPTHNLLVRWEQSSLRWNEPTFFKPEPSSENGAQTSPSFLKSSLLLALVNSIKLPIGHRLLCQLWRFKGHTRQLWLLLTEVWLRLSSEPGCEPAKSSVKLLLYSVLAYLLDPGLWARAWARSNSNSSPVELPLSFKFCSVAGRMNGTSFVKASNFLRAVIRTRTTNRAEENLFKALALCLQFHVLGVHLVVSGNLQSLRARAVVVV